MEIANLFINLGIKGDSKTVGALNSVQKGMKETASLSLEAKAAIIGAMYALERLFATSGKQGTDLTNFNALLGMSTQTLQKYQYAARQVGISNDEVSGTFKKLSDISTNILLGKGAPEGMARIAQVTRMQVGELQQILSQASKGNAEPLFKVLDQYSKAEKDIGLRNKNLKDFVSDNMISGMARNAFRPEILAKAPTYSDDEIAKLDKANIAWSNIGTKIEMAVGHFNAAHGGDLVKDFSELTDKVIKLAEALEHLAEKAKIFDLLNKVFGATTSAVEGTADLVEGVNNLKPKTEKQKQDEKKDYGTRAGEAFATGGQDSSLVGILADMLWEKITSKTADKEAQPRAAVSPGGAITPSSVTPKVGGGPSQTVQTQNVNVNQSLNFQHDGKDAGKVSDTHKKAVRDAYFQIPSISVGN